MKVKIESDQWCPLIKKKCVGSKCSWFTHIRGENPQTGEDVDEYSCAVSWLPMLLIENSKQQRSTAAAVESFRNESCTRTDIMNNLLSGAQMMIQEANIEVEEPDK